MRVRCIHGYFTFEETGAGQVSDFMSLTGLPLVSKGQQFTLEPLEDAPEYSIAGKNLLGIPAIATFEGEPWEVFEANGFVYDLTSDAVVPIESILLVTTINSAGNRFVSPGLIQPGSLVASGARVKSYSGWFSRNRSSGLWLYSEVEYV